MKKLSITDIYGGEEGRNEESSLRYIFIVARNVVGILNRVASLMRRKRYNIEEMSVSFDSKGESHWVLAIDGRQHDVELAILQLRKLYDLKEVRDVTAEANRLYCLVSVHGATETEFKKFPCTPDRIVKAGKGKTGLFIFSLNQVLPLIRFCKKKGYFYEKRLLEFI